MQQLTPRTSITTSTSIDPCEPASLLHELNLGQHTLFLMSDGSINLLAHDKQASPLTDDRLMLDSDETYRLFISLHEQFKQQQQARETKAKSRFLCASA